MDGAKQRRISMKPILLSLAILAAAGGTAAAQSSSSSVNTPASGTPTTSPPNSAKATGEPLSGPALTAKKAIERDGYKDVQGLAKGSDGLWHGQAVRGSTHVQVTVDRSGRVSAQ
jgi:hypothetical protein